MWLLKLHFAISILCLLTFLGIKIVYKETIKSNGYLGNGEKRKLRNYIAFFTPVLNILLIVFCFLFVFIKKSDFDKWVEDHKKEDRENDA